MTTGRRPREFTLALAANVPRALSVAGRFFGIIDAPVAALSVEFDGDGHVLRRGPGGSILVADEFHQVRITSTLAQSVTVVIADEPQDVSNITSSGSGGPPQQIEAPSSTVATPDDNALPAATTEAIAANPARRRITIGVLSTETVAIRVQAAGANDLSGVEIQPGMSYRFDTTAALDVRNNDGAVATSYWIFEESGP